MSVKVEWVGHACFRVWREGGPVIVMDPYTPKTVYLPEDAARVDGDTVIVSSLTDDAHGYPELVRGRRRVIDALEVVEKGLEVEVDGSPLVTVGAAESPIHDSGSPKDNALYALQVGGVWVMHMGDLGYGVPAGPGCDDRSTQAQVDRSHALCAASGVGTHAAPAGVPRQPPKGSPDLSQVFGGRISHRPAVAGWPDHRRPRAQRIPTHCRPGRLIERARNVPGPPTGSPGGGKK